jgi:hypothetical protein
VPLVSAMTTLVATDWTAMSNVAVAIGTLVLAVFTWLGLRKADAAIKVSRSNAQAAERAAKAALESATIARGQLREEQRAFDAATGPRLVVDGALWARDGDASYRSSLKNRGPAPAVRVKARLLDEAGTVLWEQSPSASVRPTPQNALGGGMEIELPRSVPATDILFIEARYESEVGIEFGTRARLVRKGVTSWEVTHQQVHRAAALTLEVPGNPSISER